MKTLKKEFRSFKKKIKTKRRLDNLKNNLNLFEDQSNGCAVRDPVTMFIKNKRISKKEIIRFYITEMTGLSEEEFNEHFFNGKKSQEKKDVSEAIRSAVEYKLRNEIEDILRSNTGN